MSQIWTRRSYSSLELSGILVSLFKKSFYVIPDIFDSFHIGEPAGHAKDFCCLVNTGLWSVVNGLDGLFLSLHQWQNMLLQKIFNVGSGFEITLYTDMSILFYESQQYLLKQGHNQMCHLLDTMVLIIRTDITVT